MTRCVGIDATLRFEGGDSNQEVEVDDAGVAVGLHLGQLRSLHPHQLSSMTGIKDKAGFFEQFATQSIGRFLAGLNSPSGANPHGPSDTDAMLQQQDSIVLVNQKASTRSTKSRVMHPLTLPWAGRVQIRASEYSVNGKVHINEGRG